MARGKRIIGIDAVNQQIETAESEVIKAKKKYDEATDKLKSLLDNFTKNQELLLKLQTIRIEQKILHTHKHKSFLISPRLFHSIYYHNLLK